MAAKYEGGNMTDIELRKIAMRRADHEWMIEPETERLRAQGSQRK